MSDQVPATGDLLITKRPTDGQFEISIVPGRPQLSVVQQHEAVRQAHAFAERNGASVWMTDSTGATVRVQKPVKRRES